MKPADYLVALGLAGLLFAVGDAQAAEPAEQVDALLRSYHALGQFNGSALVATAGEVQLNQGYGLADMEWEIPNGGTTRHRIGSITKSFTAALVVQLAEEGQLNLDKAIRDYLPSSPEGGQTQHYPGHAGGEITLRQLLTHTGGLPSYTWSREFWQAGAPAVPFKAEEFVRAFCSAPPDFSPGERYRYGNSGYSILGAILESVTGKPYSEVLRAHILEPAGMKDSGVDSALKLMPRRASGYERTLGGYRNADPIPRPLYAAGSMVSTVEDLLRWDQALYRDAVLSAGVKQILLESRPGAVEGTFAYGWSTGVLTLDSDRPPLRYVATNGEINGFNALLLRLPDDRHTVVLLNNTGETNLLEIAQNIVRILYDLPYSEPRPRIVDVFYWKLKRSFSEAATFYRARRQSAPDDYLFFPWPLRIFGQQLLRDGRRSLAAGVLALNLETHPSDVRTLELLAAARAEEAAAPSEGRDALAAWTAASHDLSRLGSTQLRWPGADEIESFFALGISTDGWFAHADRMHGLCLEASAAKCRDESARFEVSLFNVTCDRRCMGDVDPDAGETCECPSGVTAGELEALGVSPREDLRFGEFPARFGGVEYDVELAFREKAIYPKVKTEPWEPEFPETRAFLVAGAGERRLIAAIDHNHMGVAAGVRVAGWLKHPELDRLVVLLLAHRSQGPGPVPYVLLPFAVELGFATAVGAAE